MEKQIDKKEYNFSKYCKQERWSSYWHQIDEVLKCNPKSVLEIGVGDKVFGDYIKNNTNIKYFCLDIAEDLNPDIVGSVDNMPIENNTYDLVCAFEILEHLPFEKFKKSLDELHRVSKKDVIISLPHWGRHFSIDIRIPYFKNFSWQYKCNFFPIKHKFNGQHYWEIGKKDYSLKKVKRKFKKAKFKIVKDYIAFKSPYHHFFVLKK
ncbi:MAG: class I SAM-dependent methyltransferase [Patescibacteria group bacterium]|nr:class I SAM-dependent methyltransferase [Patescibacteria group bacterium]